MSRYIDAELIEYPTMDSKWDEKWMKIAINAVPTADVREITHGHWIEQGLIPYEGIRRICSVCEKAYDTNEQLNFCPNCGAEMQNAKQELVKDSDGLVKDLVKPMSPEEAVDLLDNLLGMMEDSQGNDYDKALYMGIEAIKRGQWKGGNDEDG